jgi:hypothetical protein
LPVWHQWILYSWVRASWIKLNNCPTTTRVGGNRPSWSVPEAVITVVRAPDDGCQPPKHVELSTEV